MPRKRSKFIKIKKPKMRVTKKGIKVSKPNARIGKKSGINLSSKGISASTRTKFGTLSSRKGSSTGIFKNCGFCSFILLGFPIFLGSILMIFLR